MNKEYRVQIFTIRMGLYDPVFFLFLKQNKKCLNDI